MPSLAVPALAANLRRNRWIDQIQQAYLVLLAAVAIKFCLPGAIQEALRPLLLVLPLLPIVAKDLAHWPDAVARLRRALATRDWKAASTAFLPPELVGMLRLDRALRHGFMGWLLRRPQAQRPSGRSFGYLERGAYRTAFAFVLFSCLVELPLDAAIAPLLISDPHERAVLHGLMLAASVSSIVYALGDRWLVGPGRHVLTEDSLLLRVGARSHGAIPRQAIVRCERVKDTATAWCRQHGIDSRDTLQVSPIDKPNAVLVLQPGSDVRLTHLGAERGGMACIFLYVDRPDELIEALQQPVVMQGA